MYCVKCGNKLEDEAKFCVNCGTKRVDLQKVSKESEVVYEDPKEFVPEQKASNSVIFGVIALTMIIAIGLILFIGKMPIY